MSRGRALTKLQIALLIDIIVVASAAGGYFYVGTIPPSSLDPANVQLVNLMVTPAEAALGQTVQISVNVTNVSGSAGVYSANLMIDETPKMSNETTLQAGETKTLIFTFSDIGEGRHVVKIGNLEETLTVLSVFKLSDLAINRTEAGVGEPIGITLKITNRQETSANYSLSLSINGAVTQTKTGELEGAASKSELFEVVEQVEGTYVFKIGDLNGTFTITPSAPPPKPAEFSITDLIIDPSVAEPNAVVTVSANVTNVGELSGDFSVDFKVNGIAKGTKTGTLSGGESAIAQLNITEANLGNYTVSVGDLAGQFSVQAASKIALTNLYVKPYEVWIGEKVTVVVSANNPDSTTSSKSLRFLVDGELLETKTITLAGGANGTVEFTTTAQTEGSHKIIVNELTYGGYKVVKTGYHTLSVSSSPVVGIEFTLNGVKHTTFYSELLPVGTYTLVVQQISPSGRATFDSWDTGSKSLTLEVNLQIQTTVTAQYAGESCPSLYVWNGTDYAFLGDVSNHGWLGYINYLSDNPDWPVVYYKNNPWDYVKVDTRQIQPVNGYFNFTLLERSNEIFYLDQAYLLVVDHPANVDVYSTMVEQYLGADYMGRIYTVSKNPAPPLSALNQNGENVLPAISKRDGVFTIGTNGILSPAWDNITWNQLTLNLGDLSNAAQIKLVLRAVVDWGSGSDYSVWLDKFFAQPVPNGTVVTPPSFMEVKDVNGNWVQIPWERQIPLPADGVPRTYVVDLTGLFPTNDFSLRISNFWNVTYDFIGVDTTPQQNITIQRIDPQAYLYRQYFNGSATSTGNFTKYGNVTDLVLSEDDMFVIGRLTEAVSLQFPTANLNDPEPSMVRDYFFNDACWFKDETGNWGFGFNFTVDPLPFRNMSGFAYPPSEYYPNDTVHSEYLQQWNTRVVTLPSPSENATALDLPLAVVVVILASLVVANLSYAAFRLRRRSHVLQKPVRL